MGSRRCIAALAGVGLLAGCAGYRLGTVADLGYETVAVPMFRNRTVLPQMEAQVTNAIIKRLQTDGALKVVEAGQAAVVVHGEITKYHRTVLRTERLDTGVPREYRIAITAQVEVRDKRRQSPLVPKTEVTGSADVFIGTDLQSADYQALPLAADDLARQIVTLLAERWE